MLQQKGERVMNGLGRNDLVIVQDEDDVFLIVSSTDPQVVDQQRQYALQAWSARAGVSR